MVDNASEHTASFVRRNGGKKAVLKSAFWQVVSWFYPPFNERVDFSSVDRVVFVCKGNICRSPVAEYAFRLISHLECCSAGLDTTMGCLANERVSAIAAKHSLNLINHKTTLLSAVTLSSSDLVVCMEPIHFFQLKKLYKGLPVVLLGRYGAPSKVYIHDPYSAADEYAAGCVDYVIASTKALAQLMTAASVRQV